MAYDPPMSSKEKEENKEVKSFVWTGWKKPVNQYAGGYYVYAWNENTGKWEHWHEDAGHEKIECNCEESATQTTPNQ